MKVSGSAILLILVISSVASPGQDVRAAGNERYWVGEMGKVHSKFTGEKGTFAHFGDSITVTLAYWTPLLYSRKNAPAEMERAYELVKGYLKKECWRDWKGGNFGNTGMMTIRWAHENVETWLKSLNPEVALIMFGTNDLNSVPLAEYKLKTRQVVQKCLDNGTVVILSTIPPRHGFVEKAADYAQAVRRIARDVKVPLIDFHAEILKRRGDDWDGATDKFSQYKGYDVPTLLARDGVHPSNPKKYQDDYSAEGLRCSGYALRNYLALMKYVEVLGALDMGSSTVGGSLKRSLGMAGPKAGLINPPRQPWFPKAPALPSPKGQVMEVSNVPELIKALDEVEVGGTIYLADGHYMMPRYVEIRTDNISLRGKSGRPERVIIDGAESRHGELIGITSCSGVTIADLTIQNIRYNGFKINSQTNVQDLTIYNCIIHNIWQRGVKGVKVPKANRQQIRPKRCRVQYCLFYNDRPKRLSDDSHDIAGGNYIGGIDVMYPSGWVISDNVFVGINGATREARGAVFIWHDARDCIVERNIIINCDAGICLGNPHRDEETTVHCTGCIVRNNFITNATEGGIVPVYTKDCKILNNTIYEKNSRLGRLIRTVFDNDGLVIANNLISGPKIRNESKSEIKFVNNIEKDLADAFVGPTQGNLHLSRRIGEVIDKAVKLPEVTTDIDNQPRDPKPDIGADELLSSQSRVKLQTSLRGPIGAVAISGL
ncbi:MAG: right-handed parallel beta-helix repeat-containing protein [Planctomycetes bacterium]|nr:right-handed parallel beta-helix repeat-containing protein [Planctomycetota bacterium]MBL7152627.1 right-handed parallel beta-helix repeat-containing protein [Phycisphaerae bacterium]